jgi:uncharacterized cupin superfamily protein
MADTFTGYDGSEFTVLRRPTNPRDPLEMRFRFVPGCATPPPHVHPDTDETFTVEEGEFELLVDGEWRGVVHDPHHGFEEYLRKLTGLSHALRATSPNTPKAALRFARLWAEHPDLIRPADVPMRLAMPVLNAVGRVLRV